MKNAYLGVSGEALHCVKFYGVTNLKVGLEDDNLFLVFEEASKGSIDDFFDKYAGTLDWNDVLGLYADVATGLEELHHRGITHAYITIVSLSLTCSDLHEGNVLITTKYHKASFTESEETAAVLIDFGRGQITERSRVDPEALVSDAVMDDAKARDIFDYGALMRDLTFFWMEKTGRTSVPQFLLDLIQKCTGEEGLIEMRKVVDRWELWAFEKVAGVPFSELVPIADARERLRRTPQSKFTTTRSLPSFSKVRRIFGNFVPSVSD